MEHDRAIHIQVYRSEEERWQAVVARDRTAEGQFVLAVYTTGVFCRPGCPARTPNRENVSFFDTPSAAIRAGFRPCKRCRPTGESISTRHQRLIEEACREIEASSDRLAVEELAASAGMSLWHFQRVFKAQTGLTPSQYQRSRRARRLRDGMASAGSVTTGMMDAGYDSSSHFYETTARELGMTPSTFRAGGKGERIRYGLVQTSLGHPLVAAIDKGICSLQRGDSEEEMLQRLHSAFPNVELVEDDPSFGRILEEVAALADRPGGAGTLSLDMRGTVFQHRVWNALRDIPAGTTRTYSEIAQSIGAPTAARAVASACATNPVPLIVPCHRVIGKDGALTGYRYGVARKAALLEREAADVRAGDG